MSIMLIIWPGGYLEDDFSYNLIIFSHNFQSTERKYRKLERGVDLLVLEELPILPTIQDLLPPTFFLRDICHHKDFQKKKSGRDLT